MDVGSKIRNLRKQNGLTQEQLGDLIGVKKSAVAKYENNRVENLKRSTIAKLAHALNVPPTYFFDFSEESLLATPEDKKKIGQVDENINDEILKLKPFDNLIDAIYFIKKYDVKLSEGINFNKMTGDSILALINTILTATQETIIKERKKK